MLVLEVKTWPSNTRLAKAVAASGLARSNASRRTSGKSKSWLIQRAKADHRVRLDAAAADALLELVPPELGILAQEVAKLALVAGDNRAIDVDARARKRRRLAGTHHWDMVDAAADGRAADALAQLDRLIAPAKSRTACCRKWLRRLRRFATATSLIEAAEADGRRLPRAMRFRKPACRRSS